jgi:hypothetical protein
MWLLYVASDMAVTKLTSPLNFESEQAAKKIPSPNELIEHLGRGAGDDSAYCTE